MNEKKLDIIFAAVYFFLIFVLLAALFLKVQHNPLGSYIFISTMLIAFVLFRIEKMILKKRIKTLEKQINKM